MKNYYRIMLGKGGKFIEEGLENNCIGADFEITQDLTHKLPDEWRSFNKEFIPIYLQAHPEKSRVAAGLACGALYSIAKGIHPGDIVLCPDGKAHYYVGEVNGDYYYHPGAGLPHRRPVKWYNQTIDRSDMSDPLKMSTGSIGTFSTISAHAEEIVRLISGIAPPSLISTDETVEDPSAFAMEQHLENFLVKNWGKTELGKEFDIFEEEGELVGQQYATDTGPIDILAISKDKKTILVLELKKGRASDVVVGQILRYMGYVQEEFAEKGQKVKGIIIAQEDDQRVRSGFGSLP